MRIFSEIDENLRENNGVEKDENYFESFSAKLVKWSFFSSVQRFVYVFASSAKICQVASGSGKIQKCLETTFSFKFASIYKYIVDGTYQVQPMLALKVECKFNKVTSAKDRKRFKSN